LTVLALVLALVLAHLVHALQAEREHILQREREKRFPFRFRNSKLTNASSKAFNPRTEH